MPQAGMKTGGLGYAGAVVGGSHVKRTHSNRGLVGAPLRIFDRMTHRKSKCMLRRVSQTEALAGPRVLPRGPDTHSVVYEVSFGLPPLVCIRP